MKKKSKGSKPASKADLKKLKMEDMKQDKKMMGKLKKSRKKLAKKKK